MIAVALPYRGRFAPSPTGHLHAGSLSTAIGSYLEARCRGGEWLLRIEDIDPPREVAGAAAGILHTLEQLGFEWDGPVLYQHTRLEAYQAALNQLQQQGLAYGCGCSRSEIAAYGRRGLEGWIYPNLCRDGLPQGKTARAWRMRVPAGDYRFYDRLRGWQQQNVAADIGDFVLRRADGLFAYQLAVVVDDAAQGITDVVRGADLLDSTARQIVLQQALQVPTPSYCHLPLLVNQAGEKLSKQTLAPPLDLTQPAQTLRQGLQRLGLLPPPECQQISELWQWARAHWQLSNVNAACQVIDRTP